MIKKEDGTTIYEQGDVVWVNFNPTSGHEQKGRRPALVFSIADTQVIDGLMMVLPITSTESKRILSVDINVPDFHGVYGKILVDQVRSIDPETRDRDVSFLCRCPEETFAKVDELFDRLIHK
jgi:mRNA interferase MazF